MDHKLVPSIPLFAGIGRRGRKDVARLVDEVSVPAGTPLVREGAYSDAFYVIVSGEARVTARHASTAHVSTGSEPLGRLGPGDFFGEVGLLGGPARSASVVAESPMRLLVASSRDFSTLRHAFPLVGERIRAALAARIPAAA